MFTFTSAQCGSDVAVAPRLTPAGRPLPGQRRCASHMGDFFASKRGDCGSATDREKEGVMTEPPRAPQRGADAPSPPEDAAARSGGEGATPPAPATAVAPAAGDGANAAAGGG